MVALASCALAGVAVAQTTDTTLDPSTVPSTDPSTTTTTVPPTSTTASTTTTAPSSTTPTPPPVPSPGAPADSVHTPTAAEDAVARAAFAQLTDTQRTLLKRLQTARDDLAVARGDVVDLAGKVAAARAKSVDAEREAVLATDQVTQAEGRLRQLRATMAKLASVMYEHLGDGVLLETINTADRSALNRVRTYAKAPQATLDTLVARAQATTRRLDGARQRASEARGAQPTSSTRCTCSRTISRMRSPRPRRATTDAETAVSDALGSNVAFLAQVADPHFGADAITAALAAAQTGDDDPGLVLGMFRLPVPGAALGSPYGIRVDPLHGSIGYHPGIDLEGGSGESVHAAAAGTVAMAGDCGGYGNCVVIDHGHSVGTVYADLSRSARDRRSTGGG